jgi:two-component system chemotaxis response regulator CheY
VKLREMDPSARVIVVSADVQTSSRELVQAAGAAGFITKPASGAQVVGMVEQVMKGASPWN